MDEAIFRKLGRGAAALAIALVLPACAPTTPIQRSGVDQNVTTRIMWRYRDDARLSDIRVTCVDRMVTLKGRVPDPASARDALRIAESEAGSGSVVSQLEIRPR